MAKYTQEYTTTWLIDGSINLTQVAIDAEWHLASTIAALTTQGVFPGLSREDAEAYAEFIFAERAGDSRSMEQVSESQEQRLSVGTTR